MSITLNRTIKCDQTGEVLEANGEVIVDGYISMRGAPWITRTDGKREYLSDFQEDGAPVFNFVDEDVMCNWIADKIVEACPDLK